MYEYVFLRFKAVFFGILILKDPEIFPNDYYAVINQRAQEGWRVIAVTPHTDEHHRECVVFTLERSI